jgi:uncharacterized protein
MYEAAMPLWLNAWLDGLSARQLALVFCAFFVAITWLGTLLVHPLMRRVLHRNEPSNELIIHIAGTFGLVYAVLLGLLTVATFQNTKDVQDDIGREASDLSTIYSLSDSYPEPFRDQIKAGLRDYSHYIIDKDWPAHRRGIVLVGGEHRLEVIRATLMAHEPATKTQEQMQDELLRYLDAMRVSREQRLAAVTASIPQVLWYVVFIGAFLMIGFVWMLHMELVPQIILGGITAFFLGIMIFLIYAMDRPLQSAVSVPPDAFRSVYNLVMKWDEPGTPGEETFASIGTGQANGVYYPVGKAICQIVNRDIRTNGVRCSAETTPGSVYNIDAIQSGELEFGIAQSDVQFAAYSGEGEWEGRPFRGLRSVASLYPELVTVIARANAHINSLEDLAGRRVNVGSKGTGTRATWDAIEEELGWTDGRQVRPVELRADATTSALCSGAIDANLLIVGHPSPLVKAQQTACPITFVALAGPAIDKLIHDHPYYRRGIIPGEIYGIASDVPTFGGLATLVTSASVDARAVSVIAKAVLGNVVELRTLHPALARLTAGEMINGGLTAPLHPAAARVYKELGLLE